MKSLKLLPCVAAGMVLFGGIGSVAAQSMPVGTGYVQDARGNVVKNSSGQCWRTGSWSPELAIYQCDPALVAAPRASPVAMTAAPAPTPVAAAPVAKVQPTETWQTKITKTPVRLDGASFDVGSSELKRGDIAGLNEVVETARDHPEIIFVVEGYTSNTGGEEMNMRLSQDRAASTKRYLVAKGVDPLRITTKGFGEANPIADNNTAQGREDNRRVEIRYTVTEETRVRAQYGQRN